MLIVTTSNERLGESGLKTGVTLESLLVGYFAFLDAGLEVAVCSPLGGPVPFDPLNSGRHANSKLIERYKADARAREDLSDALMLSQISSSDLGGAYYPDGRGALWDLVGDQRSAAIITRLRLAGLPCAFVGYGAAALLRIRRADGAPFVAGCEVTAPTQAEDAAFGIPEDAPALGRGFAALGATYSTGEAGASHVVEDGNWVMGQNAASSEAVVRALLRGLRGA